MVDDRACSALLNKDSTKDQAELDIGDSVDRPDTFEEAVARIYNDPDILFTTESLPSLHEFFANSIDLPFNEMPGGPLTAEDVKSRIGDARAKVIQVSVKI